ncbi:D-tyrosyl-tRNA(Tyr) deacylase [Weissella diestrammenae]|uniref:D-aminoacyl-tRNA deacylase n=1 Tax=Weissella diestrammenae TaxID=1162633 RepID=A0A7G9T5R2_9LACO|nr:D-aminoacyl-tRNA deacylase [Weissella diestrammenae]MCM0582264.1 D-tyrosyl-tRNA(Tyr) deacylase [Weissella diestrammenae]QNN75437.1 D-tyrosyl-tRNA(Tyr) deacylase [Weissella diestrammenae]
MRVLLQRVKSASVSVQKQIIGQIEQGYVLLVGIQDSDTVAECQYLVRKILGLRVFSDADDKMNLNLEQVNGAILSISQFTLYADTKKGNRPSFVRAGQPAHAQQMYQYFNQALAQAGVQVETGEFGADMQISLINDGPVTIWFDTDKQ